MKRVLKLSILSLSVLLFLFTLLIIFLPLFIDLKDYEGFYIPSIEQKTGRGIEIDGLRLSLFPQIGLKLSGLKVYPDLDKGKEPEFETEEIRIAFYLLPLLKREVIAKEVILYRPRLNLAVPIPARPKAHKTLKLESYALEHEKEDINAAAEMKVKERKRIEAKEALILFPPFTGVKSLSVKKGSLLLKGIKLDDINLDIEGFSVLPDRNAQGQIKPFSYRASALLNGVEPLTADGELRLKLKPQGIEIIKTVIELMGQRLSLNGSIKRIFFNPSMNLNLEQKGELQKILSPDDLKGLKIKGSGRLNAELLGTLERLDIKGLIDLTAADVIYQEVFHKPDGIPFVFSYNADLESMERLIIKSGDLKISHSNIPVKGVIASLKEDPTFDIGAKIKEKKTKDWERFILPLKGILLKDVDSSLKVSGRMSDTTKFLFKGEGFVRKISYRGQDFSNLKARLSFKHGVLTIKDLTTLLYGGLLSGDAKIDFNNEIPSPDRGTQGQAYNLNLKVQDVDTNALLTAYTSLKDTFYGRLLGDIRIDTKGKDDKDLLSNAKGEGNFVINEGRLASFNIAKEVMALGLIKGYKDTSSTEFESLSGNFSIKEERLVLEEVRLKSEDVDIIAPYAIISLNREIDLKGKAVLSHAISSKIKNPLAGLVKDEKGRIVIPFKAKGKVTAPKFSLDEDVIKDSIKEKWKDKDKRREIIKDLLKELGI